MIAFQIVKALAQIVSEVGVGTVVGNVVKVTTPTNINMYTKACTTIGGLVLGAIAGSAASKYTGSIMDEVYTAWTVQKQASELSK